MTKFLGELLKRFMAETPWFFRVIQILSAITAVVLLGPDLIEAVEKGGFELPVTWKEFVGRAVGIATMVSVFIAQLTATTDAKEKENIQDK